MMFTASRLFLFIWTPIFVGLAFFFFQQTKDASKNTSDTSLVSIRDKTWAAEKASTPDLRTKGLSNRESLCDGCAMLFEFETEGEHGFWMKDMRFAIDIAWIRDAKVVHIERRVPADYSGVIIPSEGATEVLETNAGDMEGISVGDAVSLSEQ